MTPIFGDLSVTVLTKFHWGIQNAILWIAKAPEEVKTDPCICRWSSKAVFPLLCKRLLFTTSSSSLMPTISRNTWRDYKIIFRTSYGQFHATTLKFWIIQLFFVSNHSVNPENALKRAYVFHSTTHHQATNSRGFETYWHSHVMSVTSHL